MAWVASGFNEEIERIKREVSIQQLVESYGVELKKKGKDLVGLCPMHNDKSPSLVVTPGKNLWHCLGACQEGGSIIDWIMKIEGVSLRHSLEILKERHWTGGNGGNGKGKGNIIIAAPPKSIKKSTIKKLENPFDSSLESQELLKQVVEFYHETLKQNKTGLDYLASRKINNPAMIKQFKLGLANRTLPYRLPEKNRKAGAEIRGKLQELGILRESGHEHFHGSLVIPILDEKGNVLEIYGRKLRDNLRKGTIFHLYLPGPQRGVFNFSSLVATKEIILCEALIDALTFWCHGFYNVTSSYGINGFTKDHLEAFKRFGTERILIAYDRDDAGDKAAGALAEKLISEGIDCARIMFPLGLDVNEYAQQTNDVKKAFQQLIQNAYPMGKNLVNANSISTVAQVKDQEQPAAKTAKDKNTTVSGCDLEIPAEIKPDGVIIQLENRQWRIRGLAKNMSYEILRVNLRVSKDKRFYLDTLDLYAAKQRGTYIKQAAAELEVEEEIIKKDLGRVLLKLEELQDDQIKQKLEPKKKEQTVKLSDQEKKQALELLKDPRLLDRILEDFKTCGVVGEETNKLVGYLASVSRKLDRPLAILIQSSSAAGKTWLMESVLSFVPQEERIKYSALTGQSLFYMGESNIKHKILAIVEEEGAQRTSYALKLLQSEGELSIASTGKDSITGELTTKEYRVEGPVMVFSTTTNIDIDEELQNRCIILTVDESREQTRAIHQMQREQRTVEGLRARKGKLKLLTLHRNAQRLLRPLSIINPYAKKLTFLDDKTRTRRDHEKYLSLIDSIAFLHQFQRPIRSTGYGDNGRPDQNIIVSLDDIELANRLANEVLGRSLDELPPQTRRFLMLIEEMVKKDRERLNIELSEYRFTRRQICEYSQWSLTQVRLHLQRLVDHEYVLVHRGNRGLSFVYELLYNGEGKNGNHFIMGLIDVNKLRKDSGNNKSNDCDGGKSGQKGQKHEHEAKVAGLEDKSDRCDANLAGLEDKKYEREAKVAGENGGLSGSKRGQNAPMAGGCRSGAKPLENKVLPIFLPESEKNAQGG